jgi:hypothetical protein
MIVYWATTYMPITKGNVSLLDTIKKLDVKFKKREKLRY